MTSQKTTLLLIILCLGMRSLCATTGDHTTSTLQPNDPDKATFDASQDAFKGIPIGEPHSGEPVSTGLSDSPPRDVFESLFGKEDTLPSLIPTKSSDGAHRITAPIHTNIKGIPYHQYRVIGGQDAEEPDLTGGTGYKALNNGLLSVEIPQATEAKMAEIINKMHDRSVCEELFAHESSTWRSTIIKKRLEMTFKNYLTLHYYRTFLNTITTVIKGDGQEQAISEQVRAEIEYVAGLLEGAVEIMVRTHGHKGGPFILEPQEIYAALEESSQTTKSESGIAFEQRLAHTYLADLETLSGELRQGKNHNEIVKDGKVVYKEEYAPQGSAETLDGSWLSRGELKDLTAQTIKNPAGHLMGLKGKEIPVHFLEYAQKSSLDDRIANAEELAWLSTELKKKAQGCTALFLISFEKEWTSCLITKSGNRVLLTVTDPYNKDRSTEKGMISLAGAIQDGLSTKPTPKEKKEDAFKEVRDQEKPTDLKKSEVNYDAPLANLKDEELPTLEDFFGDKIPNEILVSIKQLKKEVRKGSVGEKLKNGFMLYGPPGTGKSTIAQVMARMAGRDIIYAGGGDFRDAYQGSGKAKLDALFAEAKKRGNCIILIDEIDGTSNKLQPHNSTQEDNRAIKSLITTLDQYRYDPDIYVICTTNYPENIDPAIMRRFKRLEIPLPKYAQRKKIINYYLKRNGIKVASRTPHALSPDFYDKLISATQGFSGDTLGEMINSAVYEMEEGLVPESRINLDFRTKGIDFSNKSLLANLGELALLPLTPLFMMVGESDLDKHVYSQYKRQLKVIADLKENERKNDPRDRFAKEPFFTRLFKRNLDLATTGTERGFWDMLIRHGWNKTFKTIGLL